MRQKYTRLNIVVDVNDISSEMDSEHRERFQRSFNDAISNLSPADQQEHLERLQKYQAESEGNKPVREAYLAAIKNSVQQLRKRGVPTLYLTVGNSNELFPRAEAWPSSSPVARDPTLLKDTELTRVAPQSDEDIFRKRFMNGFTDITHVRASPELQRYVTGQRHDGANYEQATYKGPTLDEHLKSMGVKHVSIMGGMTDYCITDNTIGAAMNGYDVTVIPSLVIPGRLTVWDQSPEHAARETAIINKAFDGAISNPPLRGYKVSEADDLKKARQRIEFQSLPEYLASLPNTPDVEINVLKGQRRNLHAIKAEPVNLGNQESDADTSNKGAAVGSGKTKVANNQKPQPTSDGPNT